MQGSAVCFVLLTVIALFQQERLNRDGTVNSTLEVVRIRLSLWESIRLLGSQKLLQRLFTIIFIATMGVCHSRCAVGTLWRSGIRHERVGDHALDRPMGGGDDRWWCLTAFLIWFRRPLPLLIGLGCLTGLLGFGIISYASDAALVNLFQVGVWLISMGRGTSWRKSSVLLVMSLTGCQPCRSVLGGLGDCASDGPRRWCHWWWVSA